MLTNQVYDSAAYSDLRKAIQNSLKAISSVPGISVTQEMKAGLINNNIVEYAKKISLEIGKKEDQVKAILERKWSGESDSEYTTTSIKYRAEEYVALNGEVAIGDTNGEFVREGMDVTDYGIPYVKSISLIHKVREVQALIGFSRLEPLDEESASENNKITAVNIKEDDTRWYPGYEVRGEGIFIEFDDDEIDIWRSNNKEISERVALLNDNYKKSYYGSKKEREISAKYLLLHTISHLLMKQLSFECGYNIASLKERIYCSEPADGRSMSGILIYTASGDSEGTMGGLVRQGRPDVFPDIFKKAIESAVACSNDPVCSLSQGQGRDSLNLSACYSCALVPETSCEEFNVFLDRGTVIGTFESPEIGIYSAYIRNNEIPIKAVSPKVSKQKEHVISRNQEAVLVDYGMDLSGSDYISIWKNMMQFSMNENEGKLLKSLIENSQEFDGLEKPRSGAAFNCLDKNNLSVDLVWVNSRVMLFSDENREEYLVAKDSGWKCFSTCDENVTWQIIKDSIKEM